MKGGDMDATNRSKYTATTTATQASNNFSIPGTYIQNTESAKWPA